MMNKVWIALFVLVLSLWLTACGHEHKWIEATCIEPKKCSECGETDGEALGHKWTEATCLSPKTCEVCGETEGNPLGHTVDVGICSRCGTIANEKLIEDIFGYCNKAAEEWQEANTIVTNANISSLPETYSSIMIAQIRLDMVKDNMQSAYDMCGDYEGVSSLKKHFDKVIKAIPDNLNGSDRDSIVLWIKDFATFDRILSTTYSEMASYVSELSKAQ